MRSNKSKGWQRCSAVPMINLLSLYQLLLLILPILVISRGIAAAEHFNIHKDPQSYVLQKLSTHDIVFLGTRHKKETILKFVSGLIPRLHEIGTTHLGLEICSDQQGKIDNFLQKGNGLGDMKINEELVKTLKKCVELLTQFKLSVPDPQGWQEMLDVFQETIKVGERAVGEKTLH